MLSLVLSFVVLLAGYCVYGKIIEKIFSPDDRDTPAVSLNDGVDYVPITSGDTAFRSARLIISEVFGMDQKPMRNRLIITVPLLGVGAVLTQFNFSTMWRYFSWSNQTLAMISLWVATAYLVKHASSWWVSLVTAIPAVFMSAVVMTYILAAEEGLHIAATVAYPIGIAFAVCLLVIYFYFLKKTAKIGKEAGNRGKDGSEK